MPPLSYIVIAIALAGLVVAGLYLTYGYAIFLFYWAFAAAACVLAVVGIFRISLGLEASFWVGPALASPAIVWAAERLFAWRAPSSSFIAMSFSFRAGAILALTIAAVASVRVIEAVSVSNAVTRIAYGVLALSLVLSLLGVVQYAIGTTWTRNAAYSEFIKWAHWPILIAKYGAFIIAPIALVVRRNVEWWTLIPIVGVAAVDAYFAAFPSQSNWIRQFPLFHGLWLWLKPVVFFVAGAAIWRIGSILLWQRIEKKTLSAVTG